MAARSIVVKTEDLKTAAVRIEELADDYQTQFQTLYSNTDKLKSAWSGTDNTAFINQISGFEDDFTKMYTLMNRYASFLRTSAKAYEAAQEQVISQAKSLKN